METIKKSKKSNSPMEDYMLLHYVIKNENIKEYSTEIFTNSEIKNIFSIIKDVHIKDSIIPNKEIIHTLLEQNEIKIDNKLLSTILDETTYDKNIVEQTDFWVNRNIKWLEYKKHCIKTMEDIELIRDFDEWQNKTKIEDDNEKEDPLENTPFIPDEFYERCPNFIKKTTKNFLNDKRKRDMFLTSEFVMFSSLFNNVFANYGDLDVWSNLFSFISTGAANGKSVVLFNRIMMSQITQEIESFNTEDIEKSKQRHFFIPADSSQAALINKLNNNDGVGLIFDTEADVVSETNKQEWGNYSTLIRKSCHHEPIETNRIDKFFRIEKPKLSILLTGTIEQIFNFIKNAEDGTLTRVLFYTYKEPTPVWISQKPSSGTNKNRLFSLQYSTELKDIYDYYKNSEMEFVLSDEQWNKFDDFFSLELNKAINFDGSDAMVKRQGLMCFRLMMILSIFRKYENRKLFEKRTDIIECEDVDFDLAIDLIKVYSVHSNIIFNNIDKLTAKRVLIKNEKEKLFYNLGEEFNRKELLEQAKKLDISERSVGRQVNIWIKNKMIEKLNRSTYKKIK